MRRCKVQRDWSDTEGGSEEGEEDTENIKHREGRAKTQNKEAQEGHRIKRDSESKEDVEAVSLSALMSSQQSPCSLRVLSP